MSNVPASHVGIYRYDRFDIGFRFERKRKKFRKYFKIQFSDIFYVLKRVIRYQTM